MARLPRSSAGFWNLSTRHLAGVVFAAAALALTPLILLNQASSPKRSPESSSIQPSVPPFVPSPAPEASDGMTAAAAVNADIAPVALPSGTVVASSATSLESDGIVIDVIGATEGEAPRPVIDDAPDLEAIRSVTGNMMLRVRWRRAEGPVTAYRVHCTKVGPAPAWVEELDAALENGGSSHFRQELDTVTARTETYFNNGFPVPGAPYRCSVTPTGPNGDGASVVATVVVAPVGSDLSAVGPALEIASVVQISGALSVSLTDESAAAPEGIPILYVRCIDVATGESKAGFRGDDELSSPVIVGGAIAGHQYDCVASAPFRGVSAVVRSAVIAQVAAGVPAAPQSAWVQGRSLGKLTLVAVATGVQTPGTALGLSVRCVERSTGRVEAGTEAHTFDGTNSDQWFWVTLDSVAPGTWDCAFAFVNDRGAGPSLSVAARVEPKLLAPTGFTYLDQDGANGVFRVKVQADAWDAGGERALGVGCMNLTDNSPTAQDFNLDELEQTGDGGVEFRVPVTPGAPYRCEYTVYLDFSGEATLGLFGVPYEFTAADSRSIDPARSEDVAREPDDESMMLDPVVILGPPSIVDSSVPSADAPDLRIVNAPTPEPSVPQVAADSPPVAPQATPPTDSALVVPPARPDDEAMPGA